MAGPRFAPEIETTSPPSVDSWDRDATGSAGDTRLPLDNTNCIRTLVMVGVA